MKACTCCARPVTAPQNVRPFVCEVFYQLYFECPHCMSTMAVTLWEAEETEEEAA